MPGKPRMHLPDMPQHVIQRGNNRNPCFYAETDYLCCPDVSGKALLRHECRLHACVPMTNHVHLPMWPTRGFGISLVLLDTGRKFVRYINRTCRRTGTLWEGRYKTCVIDSDAWLLTCMRYMKMNPVRAGMVLHTGEYRWSGCDMNARGRGIPAISPQALYLSLGGSRDRRRFACRELSQHYLDESRVHTIRKAHKQELVPGREDFKNVIERITQRQVRCGVDGRPRTGRSSGR